MSELKSGARLRAEAAKAVDAVVREGRSLDAVLAELDERVSPALPGVAIAAALVPPIASSGLAFSLGDFHLASNAFILFVVNMCTIVLASTLTFWMVGFRSFSKTSRWIINMGIIVMASVLALVIVLLSI